MVRLHDQPFLGNTPIDYKNRPGKAKIYLSPKLKRQPKCDSYSCNPPALLLDCRHSTETDLLVLPRF